MEQSRQRIEAGLAARGVKATGSRPGGLQEAMGSPEALAKSRELVETRRKNMQSMKDVAGVKTVKRGAKEADVADFKGGSETRPTIRRNPYIQQRAIKGTFDA